MLCVNKPKRVVSVAKRVVIPTGGVAVVEEFPYYDYIKGYPQPQRS